MLQFIWLKSEINLLLSNFFQSRFRILDFVTETFEKKICKKINIGGWSENVDVTLPDSVSPELAISWGLLEKPGFSIKKLGFLV